MESFLLLYFASLASWIMIRGKNLFWTWSSSFRSIFNDEWAPRVRCWVMNLGVKFCFKTYLIAWNNVFCSTLLVLHLGSWSSLASWVMIRGRNLFWTWSSSFRSIFNNEWAPRVRCWVINLGVKFCFKTYFVTWNHFFCSTLLVLHFESWLEEGIYFEREARASGLFSIMNELLELGAGLWI